MAAAKAFEGAKSQHHLKYCFLPIKSLAISFNFSICEKKRTHGLGGIRLTSIVSMLISSRVSCVFINNRLISFNYAPYMQWLASPRHRSYS